MSQNYNLCSFIKNNQDIFKQIFNKQIQEYLKNKKGISKQQILDFIIKDVENKYDATLKFVGFKNIQELITGLLKTILIFDINIKLKYKNRTKKVNILTTRLSLLDFLSNGFLHYIFKSKYFWGYDKVLYDLGLYKTYIRFLLESDSVNRLSSCGKPLFLVKNIFGKHWLVKSQNNIIEFGKKLKLYETQKVYQIARICF